MIGAPYEGFPKKSKDFYPLVSRSTDDTVLTVAVVSDIMMVSDYADTTKEFSLL